MFSSKPKINIPFNDPLEEMVLKCDGEKVQQYQKAKQKEFQYQITDAGYANNLLAMLARNYYFQLSTKNPNSADVLQMFCWLLQQVPIEKQELVKKNLMFAFSQDNPSIQYTSAQSTFCKEIILPYVDQMRKEKAFEIPHAAKYR